MVFLYMAPWIEKRRLERGRRKALFSHAAFYVRK